MLIRHLKFFVTLAEEQHFGRAAEMCNVTQPTLSHAIRKLEDDLNLGLIVRGHRFLALTPEGEKLLRWGRQIISDYDSLRDDLSGRERGGLTGCLRLGVIPAAMPAVAALTEAFETRHPRAEIEVRSMSSRSIQKALDNFEIDGGMTYLDNEPLQNVRCFTLYSERYVFACGANDPYAARESVSWAEAVSRPLCLLSGDMQNRRILDSIAAKAGIALRPKVVTNSFLGVVAHLRNGKWCAIVPHSFGLVFGDNADLLLKPLVAPCHAQEIGLVLADRMPQSPMAHALEQCAVKAKAEQTLMRIFDREALILDDL